jgi:hypothetical protein
MKPRETVEEALRNKLRFAAASTLRDRWRKEVLQAHVGANHHSPLQTETRPALREPTLRRMIMRNSYVKLSLAAVVILAVVLGVTEFLGPGGKSGVAWGQVLEKAEQAPTVVFDMTREISYPQGRTLVSPSKNYISEEYGYKSEVYYGGTLFQLKYRLYRQKVAYNIRPDRKQYWRSEYSDEEAVERSRMDDPRAWLKAILSSEYTKLGRTTINGVTVEGIEYKWAGKTGGDNVMRLWVDVETNLPVRIEREGLAREEGQMRPVKYVMENFEWNVPLDESLFEPNIPADYTLQGDPRADQARQENPRAQPTPPRALTEQEQAAVPQIKEMVQLYLQALCNRNWDEIAKYVPGLAKLTPEQRASADTRLDGLQVGQVGQPFKTEASDLWYVPCQIGLKGQAPVDGGEVRVRYDPTLGRFVVAGGP